MTALVRSLQQQQAIETASINDRRNYFIYFTTGYKLCSFCSQFVKWPGRACPFCYRQLRTGPRGSEARRRFQAWKALVRKNGVLPVAPDKRFCSNCGATRSALDQPRANGKRYARWHSDRKGGHICKPCYDKRKRELKKKAKADTAEKTVVESSTT